MDTGVIADLNIAVGKCLRGVTRYVFTSHMFEQFSRGYYLGRLYVEPRDDDAAAMCQRQHERVNEQLYTDAEGVERTDHPLVMKVGSRHFPVFGAEDVPAGRLAVPRSVLEAEAIDNPPTLTEVLLATADRAGQVLRLTSGQPIDDFDGSAGI